MADALVKKMQGDYAVARTTEADVEDALGTTKVYQLGTFANATSEQLLEKPKGAKEVKRAWAYSNAGVAADANAPTLQLLTGDLEGGATTAVSAILDITSTALVALTKLPFVISTPSVAADEGLIVGLVKGTTPADVDLCVIVEWGDAS